MITLHSSVFRMVSIALKSSAKPWRVYAPAVNGTKLRIFIMGRDLDFVFYRGLRLVETVVMDADKLSNHNPMFVRFERVF